MAHDETYKSEGPRPERTPVIGGGVIAVALLDGDGGFAVCPELLTEDELIRFLRIPEISNAKDYHNVVENLKRMHDLPRIHICGKPLYPREAVREWIRGRTTSGK